MGTGRGGAAAATWTFRARRGCDVDVPRAGTQDSGTDAPDSSDDEDAESGRRGGAILADGMGLGKTVQALAAVHALLQQGGARKAAVLCPATLTKNWTREIRKLMPKEMRAEVIDQSEYEYPGAPKRKLRTFAECAACHVCVVSHDMATRHAATLLPLLDVIVIDEAHVYKSAKTAKYKALAARLPPTCARLLLTGPRGRADISRPSVPAMRLVLQDDDASCPTLQTPTDSSLRVRSRPQARRARTI